MVDVFIGDLTFPGMIGVSFSDLQLPELPNPSPTYTGVLGRDVMDQGALRLDGRTKELILTF